MKYKSTLFDEARNKIGGIVASANKDGNYFRSKVTPHNPKSSAQLAVRGNFSLNSQAWRALTDAQRASWTSLALQVTLSDSLGNKYKPSGQQLYVSCAGNLNSIGAAPIDTAPGSPDKPDDLTGIGLTATVGPGPAFVQQLNLTLLGQTTTSKALISATALYSAGRTFVGRGQLRVLTYLVGNHSTGIDIDDEYAARFGGLVLGSKLTVQAVSISPNGFASLPLRADAIVSAP